MVSFEAYALVNFDYPIPFERIKVERKGNCHLPWAIFTTEEEAKKASKNSQDSKIIKITINYENNNYEQHYQRTNRRVYKAKN